MCPSRTADQVRAVDETQCASVCFPPFTLSLVRSRCAVATRAEWDPPPPPPRTPSSLLTAVCGNGACEIGVSCQTPGCAEGCAADCARWGAMVDCPTPSLASGYPALPCANRGVCEPRTGFCSCFKGYVGDGCTICDANYELRTAFGVRVCVRSPPASCQVMAGCACAYVDGCVSVVACMLVWVWVRACVYVCVDTYAEWCVRTCVFGGLCGRVHG